MRETPDIETSSAGYAGRFSGEAGRYFLGCQEAAVMGLMDAPPGASVLDVGGGHGQLAPFLSAAGYKVTIAGSANECFDRLRGIHGEKTYECITVDLLDLPLADNSVDIIISVRLISHIEAWPRLLEEFCRVARNSVIIDYPSTSGLNALTPLLFGLKKKIERNTRTYTSFSRKALAQEFDKHDFSIAASNAQFFLPMGLHRGLGGARALQALENFFSTTGLTDVFGSPVILRADRKDIS